MRYVFALSALILLVGGRKSSWPIKSLSDEVLAWLSVWSKVQNCKRLANPEWFILLVLAYLGCLGKKAIKRALLLLL